MFYCPCGKLRLLRCARNEPQTHDYKTTATVLLGILGPDELIALTRYSSRKFGVSNFKNTSRA